MQYVREDAGAIAAKELAQAGVRLGFCPQGHRPLVSSDSYSENPDPSRRIECGMHLAMYFHEAETLRQISPGSSRKFRLLPKVEEDKRMKRMNVHVWPCVLGITLALLSGCASKVLMPPKISLTTYNKIGMIRFSSNAEGNLQQFASQKFLQALQSSQPGVRVLELGDENKVLRAIQHEQVDPAAIQAIGRQYGVDAVIFGRLEISSVKPKIDLSTVLTSMSAQADVDAALTARLLETESGATLWTNSVRGQQTVGHVSFVSDGDISFGARDPENAYGRLVHWLVVRATRDFRPYYEKK